MTSAARIIPAMVAADSRNERGISFTLRVLIGLFLLVGVLLVLDAANPLTTPLGRNSGTYAYMGSHVLRGETPYITAWNHKPPLILFINALGLWLGRGTRWGIWLVEFILLAGAARAGYAAMRRFLGYGPALIGSGLWLLALPRVFGGGNFSEEYSLVFSFLALWLFALVVERPGSLWLHAALGLTFAGSFLLRPNNAGVQLAIFGVEAALLLPPLGWRKALQAALATGAGFALPLAFVSLYFGVRGAFPEFIEASFTYNLIYSSRPDVLGSLVRGTQLLGAAAWIGLAGTAFALWRLLGGRRDQPAQPLLLWLCLDAGIEIVFSGLSGRALFHYFIVWMPFLAVGAAALTHGLLPRARHPSQKIAIPLVLAAIVVIVALRWDAVTAYASTASRLAMDRTIAQRKDAVAEYVNAQTEPGETVLAWGQGAGLNFLSRRDAPTRYFLYWNLIPSKFTDRMAVEFIADLRAHPPRLIVDTAVPNVAPLATQDPLDWYASRGLYAQPRMEEFFELVREQYVLETTVGGQEIYALRR